MPLYRNTPEAVRICARCGAEFRAPFRKHPQRYCSYSCASIAKPPRVRTLLERFWAKVAVIEDAHSCWLWAGACEGQGYGKFVGSKSEGHFHFKAHRIAWKIVAGPIPDGMGVLHTCDNPPCVRNDGEGWYEVGGILHPRRGHLFLGTDADNAVDREQKGRGNLWKPGNLWYKHVD